MVRFTLAPVTQLEPTYIPDLFPSFVDMKKQFVYDPLISKRQQYLLATQVCISIDLWVSFELTLCLLRSWFAQS